MSISAINLGNSFNSGGTTVLGGVSSGLDTKALLTAAVTGQQTQITNLNDQITVNNNQGNALSTLGQLLTALQSDTKILSSPQNPATTNNVFANRSSSVTGNTTQAASNFLTTSVTSAASPGTYTISNITQVATATQQESNAFSIANADTSVVAASGSPVSGQFTAGTFTLNGQSITLTAGETLNQVAAAFNAVKGSTGISASVVKTASTSYKLVLTGTATGAINNFNLNSTQTNTISIASADTPTTGQFTAGAYTINGQTVTINAGDSLNQIAADFNTANAGVTATVQQVATGQYKIVFTGGNTADITSNAASFDLAASNNVTSGASAMSNVLFTTDQTAQDAQFQFNGVTIDRSTNTISDLVTGVTFNLLQNTNSQANASFTVSVTPDASAITTAIKNFVNDYNSFLTFYAQQTQIDTSTGAPASTAYLHSDTTLQSIYTQLSSYAASIVAGVSSSSSTLPDIGLNFQNTAATSSTPEVFNTISIDSSTLSNAITNNLTGVENLFGYNATTSSTSLGVYSPPNNTAINSFTVNAVTGNTPPYTATYTDSTGPHTVTLTATQVAAGQYSLTAPSDSGLAGLVLVYTGSGNDSGMTVSSSNGIAYLMNKLVTDVTKINTGAIAVDQQGLVTKSQSIQKQISSINTQITNTQNTLLQKFSALEAAIAAANSSLNFLNAQQSAQSAG